MKSPYEDILYQPRPVSRVHPPMPREERAAQFSPFAALTGYGAVVRETERFTEERPELSDSGQEELEWKLRFLEACGAEQPEVTVTYFRPDHRKEGGSRVRISGTWKRLDEQQRMLVLQDGTRIPVEDLLELESPLLEQPEDSP